MESILIVDDEPLARERIKRLISDIEGYHVCGEASNGEQALELIAQLTPDIVLMDIRMPGMDGLAAADQLKQTDNPPALIFCTAYDDYAIQAFKVNAEDYLLKPVRKEALQEALQSTSHLNRRHKQSLQPEQQTKASHLLVANTYKGTLLVDLDKTLYFMADQKYVTAYREEGESLIDNTLKELEKDFPDKLLRIHRNALVCKTKVLALNRDAEGQFYVELDHQRTTYPPPVRVPVSRRHAQEVREWLKSLPNKTD